MGHTGSPEHIPIHPVDGALVAHHQRGNQPGGLPLPNAGKNTFPQSLPCQRHRVFPGLCDALRWRVPGPGPHIAGRPHALLPQPQFVVKPMRILATVWRFQAQRHGPALAGAHIERLALQTHQLAPGRIDTTVPGSIDLGGQLQCHTVQLCRFDLQPETQARLVGLRHVCHHSHHHHIAPLQRRIQSMLQEKRAAQAGCTERQCTHGQSCGQKSGQICYIFCSCIRISDEGQGHKSHINHWRAKVRLLQLQGSTRHPAQGGGGQGASHTGE